MLLKLELSLIANFVTTSKAPVTTSVALVLASASRAQGRCLNSSKDGLGLSDRTESNRVSGAMSAESRRAPFPFVARSVSVRDGFSNLAKMRSQCVNGVGQVRFSVKGEMSGGGWDAGPWHDHLGS